ncbi:MAG: Bax inhibitor-1/YccA family protein [Defluviitaleaceae bacterium]|nr:Bax inhibitor-1/YccA family protein [Defluviitaleaceae bacterium]MCL2240100.1 Bax inhibitor-1/YccA family protein [Defluviitaleaceae bacterium]
MWEKEQRTQQAQPGFYEDTAQPVIDIGMADEDAVNAYIARVFGWMFIGLLVTALTTVGIVYGIAQSYAFLEAVDTLMNMFFFIVIAQLGLVWAISGRVTKMNPTTSKALFILYAAMNGLTFGFVVVLFAWEVFYAPMATIGMAFGITAVAFGIMAVYGLITRTDLTRFGNLFFMGLIGLIIASVANAWFIGSWGFDFLIIVFGLFLFMGLTAYKTNAIKHHYAQIALNPNAADAYGTRVDQEGLASNLAISGALSLYLSFINMFWFILRLLARIRR